MAVPQQEQADAAAAAEARQQAAFPPPPPYFRIFRKAGGAASPAADGANVPQDHPLQPPPLPAAPDATFQLFGELHTVCASCRSSRMGADMPTGCCGEQLVDVPSQAKAGSIRVIALALSCPPCVRCRHSQAYLPSRCGRCMMCSLTAP